MNTTGRWIMKRQASMRILVLALSGSVVFVAGCPSDRHSAGGTAYCDDYGCFECDWEKNCWPLPNQKCASNSDCKSGSVCTNIGCAVACTANEDCADGNACVTGFCA